MSVVRKSMGLSIAVSVLLVGIFGSSGASALELPGISPSGAPAFRNNVKFDLNTKSNRLRVTGRKDFTYFDGTTGYLGQQSKYTLLVNFDNGGNFLNGSVELRGGLSGGGINGSIPNNTTLVTADITAWAWGNEDGLMLGDPGFVIDLFGFQTDNIVCSPLLLIACTVSESVYVQLDDPFGGSFNNSFKTTGIATTTVPLPAVAWLFGSALGLLGWVGRRNKRLQQQVSA
jgi:hypothetical protein